MNTKIYTYNELKSKNLTEKQIEYFLIMQAKSGVLYISGKPGVAKTSIMRDIAEKLGFNYFDIRLAMLDETEVGIFPYLKEYEQNKIMAHAIPEWAVLANEKPSIIHFEELNRASLYVRNAALQLLLERQIGPHFKFNDMVFMCSSGNLGDEDGTQVEQFDAALNNRLIHVKHELYVDEWVAWAKNKVHPVIIDFIQKKQEYFYKSPEREDTTAYATPRTWTMLSDFIKTNYGLASEISEWLPVVQKIAFSYVGNSYKPFIDFCIEHNIISIQDIITDYERVKHKLKKLKIDKTPELIHSLTALQFENFTPDNLRNIVAFLKDCAHEEQTAYITHVIELFSLHKNNTDIKQKIQDFYKPHFFDHFKELIAEIKKINK